MDTRGAVSRVGSAVAVVAVVVGATVAVQGASSAKTTARVTAATCASKPWVNATYQATSTPAALAALVFSCLKLDFPKTYRHDEVGIVALNSYPWFQNVNEFGLTSTVQRDLAKLGMPPITLQDGPGGLITKTTPSPTQMPNELALGATFDPAMAALYGQTVGTQAHMMGYDGVQAPDLNLVRVPTWGRAMESFGESPVLTGEMGAAEALALATQHVIPVLKHFGPYSQETDRRELNQIVSERAYQEVYIRPFTFALRALQPLLAEGGHAVGIMCSYGNVNATKACRSPELSNELAYVGENALVRSDLDVKVDPSALLLNGVDLIKPMDTGELVDSLKYHAVNAALNAAVQQIFTTEFAAGLVNGRITYARRHRLSKSASLLGRYASLQIEQRAAVLLKNTGLLPLDRGTGRVAVVSDVTLANTCHNLANELAHALATTGSCLEDNRLRLPTSALFHGLPVVRAGARRTLTYLATQRGPYVVSVTTLGNTTLSMNGTQIVAVHGLAEFALPRTTLVTLSARTKYKFAVTWRGAPPIVTITRYNSVVDDAIRAARGAKVAIFVAYDLTREGMDRNTLELPGGQDAVIEALAARMPTIVILGTDGAVSMPWLNAVKGVLEVWNPTGLVETDRTQSRYVSAWVNLLDGYANPSGRLPVTFPVTSQQSPMSNLWFWPGYGTNVNLDAAPNGGLGIGMPWYRSAGWPVLFPFGFGLSYSSYQLTGGTLTSGTGGLAMNVGVRDTGGVAGTESVQVYADWPSALGEPKLQLVGFGTASFSAANVAAGTVKHVTITVSPDALTTYQGTAMKIVKGPYCLEASTYDGDPHSWATGSVTLTATSGGQGVAGPASSNLVSGTCPS